MLILPEHFDERIKPPPGTPLDLDNPINSDLVGDWLLNENGGTVINDLSGYNATGTLTGGVIWTAGPDGPALSFDGSTGFVSIGDRNYLDGVAQLSAWGRVYWDSPAVSTIYTWFAKYNAGATTSCNIECALQTYSDGFERIIVTAYRPPSTSWSLVSDYKAAGTYSGKWLDIAVVLDGQIGTIYLNGKLLKTGARVGGLCDSAAPVRIGASLNGAALYHPWKGSISCVGVVTCALTGADVLELYIHSFRRFRRSRIELLVGALGGAGGNAYTETINDGLGVTDSFARACAYARTLTESVGATDALGRASVAIRAMADALGLADVVSKGEAKIFSDALGLVDSLIRVWEASRSFSDTLGQTDGLTKNEAKALSDSIGVTDGPVNVSVVLRTVADSIGVTDELSPVWEAVRTIADALGITDVMSEIFEPGGVFLRTINDAVGLSDSLSAVQVLLRIMADSLGMEDAVVSVFAASRIVSDSMGLTDGIVLGRIIAVSDSLGITDDVTRLVMYLRTQNDTAGLLDSMARVVVALRTVDETVGMTDVMTKQFGALMKAVWAFMLLKHKK